MASTTPESRPQLTVRHAREEDATVMREIFNEGVQDHLIAFEEHARSNEEQKLLLMEALTDERHPILVAELRGWVLGWISLAPYDVRPQLKDIAEVFLCVRRSFRNYGVGRQLMQGIQAEAEKLKYRKLIGRVLADNGDSLRLCQVTGWREVGRHIGHDPSFEERRDIVVVEYLIGSAEPNFH
jgi:L-amino acid N-acyltransferase YncA